jgi:oxygen-independent coproporphyrinogen III oxidase
MAGIYIHIPFCKQACYYCDFHFSTSLKNKDALVKALIKEIEQRHNYLDTKETIGSIYFGGGTPSLLTNGEIMLILDAINSYFQIKKDAEITLEANPDDLTQHQIKSLKTTPINRLSIGIQSFLEKDLSWMNRAHNSKQAMDSVKMAQDLGFYNITIDLIYGTHTLTNDDWIKNLNIAYELHVNHISAYCLTIEPQTVFGNYLKKNKIIPVDEHKSAEQFEIMLEEMRKNNFVQYEISNFCKDEHYSKHNSSYWKGDNYLGLGPSAHSYNGVSRQWNVANNNLYIKAIHNNNPCYEYENLTLTQRYNEYILTTLRTMWGIDLGKVKCDFGPDYNSHLVKNMNNHLLAENLITDGNKITLTPKGKLFADKIASEFFL